jgi:hypothetical protein
MHAVLAKSRAVKADDHQKGVICIHEQNGVS